MPERTTGAVEEGPERAGPVAEPSQQPVAEGEQTPPIDLSQVDWSQVDIDLSKLPRFREYDSNMQKQLAVERKARQEAERTADLAAREAQKEAAIERRRARLRDKGLSDDEVAEETRDDVVELEQLRMQNRFYNIVFKSGLSQEEISQVPPGSNPEEFEANIHRYKTDKQLREAEKRLQDLTAEAERLSREKELQGRKESGADVVARGQPSPRPSEQDQLRRQYEAEVARCVTGMQVAQVRARFRERGLEL